jgi:hypothetical protein
MKLHKLEVYVIDFDGSGVNDIKTELQNTDFFHVVVKDSETADIGEWSDDHELNFGNASAETFRKYFVREKT